jgi:hypothetical protein
VHTPWKSWSYLLISLAKRQPLWVVIDAGANVGHHSLFYALQGAEVLSFEPNLAKFNPLMQEK